MLYWIATDRDDARLAAFSGEPLRDEIDALERLHRARDLLRVWRRINGRGVFAVVDCAGPEALDDWLTALPTYDAMHRIDIIALRAHKLFGEFAHWRETPGTGDGMLHHVRLSIDRAALSGARSPELIERAEANARRHIEGGQVIGIWREPHGAGACMAWQSRDHAELFHELDTLPAQPYLRAVDVEPMLPVPGLEHLAGWRRDTSLP
jgi:muconolactone delta-isomerase